MGALDRLANTVRAARMVGIVFMLMVVVGSAWFLRPKVDNLGAALWSTSAATTSRFAQPDRPVCIPKSCSVVYSLRVPTTTSPARLNEGPLQKCLVPPGFRAYVDTDGYIQIVPVSPDPNRRGGPDTRGIRCTP